jgi:hypothetical protein
MGARDWNSESKVSGSRPGRLSAVFPHVSIPLPLIKIELHKYVKHYAMVQKSFEVPPAGHHHLTTSEEYSCSFAEAD